MMKRILVGVAIAVLLAVEVINVIKGWWTIFVVLPISLIILILIIMLIKHLKRKHKDENEYYDEDYYEDYDEVYNGTPLPETNEDNDFIKSCYGNI